MTSWKKIEAARERRLWITQVIGPIAAIAIATGLAFRKEIAEGCRNAKDKIVNTFSKKKDSKKEEGQH